MRAELRYFTAALAAMIFGAVGSLVVLSRASNRLFTAHAVVVENAAPSFVALDRAQAQLRELHALVLERHLGDASVSNASIVAARDDLSRAVELYEVLPGDPGELPLQRAIRESLAEVDALVDRTLTSDFGSPARAERDIDTAVAQLSRDLTRASEFNAELAARSAANVDRVSSTMLPAAAAVEGLTFIAATMALLLAYRAVRRAETLADRSRAAIERRAEEMELFAGRVAHDLLSPLMTVAIALDLANRRLTEPDDAAAQSAVARGSRTLQRVRRFVSDLLEFARAGARPPPGVRASIDDAVHEVAEEFGPIARDAGVDLHIEPGRTGRLVACSPGVLISVLSNLVHNAIKYIGEGEVRRVSIRVIERREEVQVEVEDTGPGIDPADRDRLFDPYARGRDAKAPGLGLGLATVRRLVESHGGRVGVGIAPSRGSIFWFTMPGVNVS
jgi:signal transduction histidine kinase